MAENGEKILLINIEEEMKTAYIDYSMSVIVSRALPDVRDGLKPVHRRVLYGMNELGVAYNKPHKKSARIVGEVLGKYHPHGDSSVYDTMVRMAQPWSLRYPLVDGQGNFGSVDGDSPAAMRYTEARFTRLADELMSDLDKDTVDYKFNFDDTLEEPTVMPAKFPNLLVNGSSGIAVGMSTDILPHNLVEVCNGAMALVDNGDITIAELMQHISAPDFPTGGIIYGMEGVRSGFETGLGKVVLRGKAEIETDDRGRESIIITEIPYQVNKAMLVTKMAELVNEKKIEGISDLRDESDRNGMRIVVEIKRDAQANVVLSMLYKYTPLQSSLRIGNIALVNGRPLTLNLKQILVEFVKFRIEVVVRRTRFELRKAEERAHILEGLLVALDNLDAVISLIRGSKTVEEAREGLMKGDFRRAAFMLNLEETPYDKTQGLSELQAKAILAMRLQQLTGLERDKLHNEYEELMKIINHLLSILADEGLQRQIIKDELTEIRDKYGDARRTKIEFVEGEISLEDMIANEECMLSISHLGYIKRTKSSEYKSQNRGGRGSKGASVRDEDFVEQMFTANAHDYILLFTQQGRCHWLRCYEIPEGTKTSKGRAIQNLVQMQPNDKVKAYIRVEDLKSDEVLDNNFIIFCTKQGTVKKTSLRDYSRIRVNGINAISINEDDELIEAKLTNGSNEIMLAVKSGRAIRFNEAKVRNMGRTATGVRGISLDETKQDEVVGMICVDASDKETNVLVVSANGLGKRSSLEDYRVTNRGGVGVTTLKVGEKTGELIAIKAVTDEQDLIIICKSGMTIRLQCDSLREMGRATQGVRLINLQNNDAIADIAVVPRAEPEIDEDGAVVEGGDAVVETTEA